MKDRMPEEENSLRDMLLYAKDHFSTESAKQAGEHWDKVQHPLNGLGALEDILVQIAGLTGSSEIHLERKAAVIFCADNGVTEENVTQTDSSVTGIVAKSLALGKTAACRMADRAGADIIPVDMGIKDFVSVPGVLNRRIGNGTKNIMKQCAMSRADAVRALMTGIDLAGQLKREGYCLLAAGEMGIGNTTTSAACSAVMLGMDPAEVTGKGAGLSDEGLRHKMDVVRNAIKANGLEDLQKQMGDYGHRSASSGSTSGKEMCDGEADAIEVLRRVGGFDLLGMCGLFLGGLIHRIPVLIDGAASCTAALAAFMVCPETSYAMIASHVSAEPAGKLLLDAVGKKPLITANLHLGEGTGAILAMPMLDMALSVYKDAYTFDEGGVEAYQPF